jgi:hypothetical protein
MQPVKRKKEIRAKTGRNLPIELPFKSRLSSTVPPPLAPPARGGEFVSADPDPFLPLDGGGEVGVEPPERIA